MDILGTNPIGDTSGSNDNNKNQGLSGLNQAQLLNALAPGLFNTSASATYNQPQAGANLLNSSFNLLGMFSPQTFNSNSLMSAPQATMPFQPEPIPQVNGQTQAPPATVPTPAAQTPAPPPTPGPFITYMGGQPISAFGSNGAAFGQQAIDEAKASGQFPQR